MKTHSCRLLLLATAILVMVPTTADAGLLSWLSRLSGPGPFWGVEADVCLKAFPLKEREGPPTMMGGAVRLACPNAELNRRPISWYAHIGWAVAFDNPLDYTGVDAGDKSDNVWLLKLGTSFDFTVKPYLDLGVGVGVFHFGGERFDSFSRPYIEPVRVGIRPLLLRPGRDESRTEHDGWLLISLNRVIHLGTLDGASFGAPFDSFRTYNEGNWSGGITVDILRLMKKED
jgi:hypothetical protein